MFYSSIIFEFALYIDFNFACPIIIYFFAKSCQIMIKSDIFCDLKYFSSEDNEHIPYSISLLYYE